MTEDRQAKFYEPILSAAGVIASLATALSPLLPSSLTTGMFIDEKLAKPSSLVAFVLSLGMVWVGSVFSPHFNWLIPKRNPFKVKDANTPISFIHINTKHVTVFLLAIATVVFYIFLQMRLNAKADQASLQSIVYVLFFLLISYIFANLLNYTKQTYEYKEKKRRFPKAIQDLLENFGYLNQGIVVEENTQLNNNQLQQIGINQISGRLIRIKTKPQTEIERTFVVSDDAQEIYKEITP